MKIAMIGSWNADSGASIHAELVGREWVKKGIELKVFSFYKNSFHGTTFTEEDEDYVTRCFTVYGDPNTPLKMDTEAILKEDFDIFVAQDLGMIAMEPLLSIFPEIKKKAKTVNVIHDGNLSDKPEFFKFDWDKVVCFDQRYYDFLKEAYPEDILEIIPYPSLPMKPGSQVRAREALELPPDKKIVLIFGPAADSAINTPMVLDRLIDRYDIMLLLVAEVENVLKNFKKISGKIKCEFKIAEEAPDIERLYEYLYASDCMIYDKRSMPIVVVGSTIFQCMGSGCPILAFNSNFTKSFYDEVIKHGNYYELEDNLIDVFEKGKKYQKQQKAIGSYLKDKCAEAVADKFLKLFDTLLTKE